MFICGIFRKQDENALHEMEIHIKELESISSQVKNTPASTSRQELLKKMKESEHDIKELNKVFLYLHYLFNEVITKLQNNQAKMLQQISKKKNRYEKIQKELPFLMNSMVCLGQDVNKTEYWVFF